MVMLRVFVAVCAGDSLSVTLTVTSKVPASAVAPVIAAPLKRKPDGLPETSFQVYGPSPPVTDRDAAYLTPTMPDGREAVVMDGGVAGSVTVSGNVRVAVCGAGVSPSVTVTVIS